MCGHLHSAYGTGIVVLRDEGREESLREAEKERNRGIEKKGACTEIERGGKRDI